ncbi:calcium uptake protein 2, mitochondrial isoform X2 [Perognathus longimembris pacificus]|uniref:calcium uptake protein 2, mitochondrial isoform X2 n=1 Tax=Perognathus longimembris pacificus TaxID=214514 RepID=UPI0020191FC0|nr:calcium uptake protein 2, mitochondrial isoform X2 [Perognathus longimembris pacificus]
MAAARQSARLAAWGGRLRRGLAAGRRAVPSRGSLAAAVAGMALAGAGAAWHHGRVNVATREGSLSVLAQKSDCEAIEKVSLRKQRFMQFSSLEHEGEYYMTPRDFLFSVMFDQMERKTLVKKLAKKDIDDVLAGIQTAKCGSTFFRDLGDKGLISYTEYLFLLTILTKPHTGFHVAFKMLDADGNERIEKREFVKEPTVKECEMNTTLQMRFFGKRGERKLHYKEFRRFMENLQTEVQEMEFLQFSKGLNFMRKEDFAEWLLFFTNSENKDIYWKNVREKLSAGESISLDEFKSFCHFTTHLEDFAIAMQMFSLAHRPVRMAEFKRAVKVATGQELSSNILDTVFKIFDLDGDECLSHGEFLGVLKNRMHRGLWVPQQQSVQEYWKCVKKESIKGVKEVWKQAGRGLF